MLLQKRAALVIPGLFLAACSTTVDLSHGAGSSGGTGSAGGTGGAGGGAVHAEPPPPGPAAPPDSAAHLVFAVQKLFLGDTDPDGTPDLKNGWRHAGYDLDGHVSTALSTDLCKPRDNAAPKYAYPDGDDGIDNAFGRSLLPVFVGLNKDVAATVQQNLDAGQSTLLLAVDGIGSGHDYAPLAARLYTGAALGHPAAFDGSDVWPVRPESLADPTAIASATAHTEKSYLVGDIWVGRFTDAITLELPLGDGVSLRLPIGASVVSMRLDPSHQKATGGVLAGVVATDALVSALKKVVLELDPSSFCFSSADPDSLIAQFEQASDILEDGTQDPAKTCDGVSIGLRFEAVRAKLGPIAAPLVEPNPCALDAGAPDGG